jgi:hypothetical protein
VQERLLQCIWVAFFIGQLDLQQQLLWNGNAALEASATIAIRSAASPRRIGES